MTSSGDAGYMGPAPGEQALTLSVFQEILRDATKDGGRKRKAGLKPAWWNDLTHEPALFSHLAKWKRGEQRDGDSGAHPLVHLAWRALAIAYIETWGHNDPSLNFIPSHLHPNTPFSVGDATGEP